MPYLHDHPHQTTSEQAAPAIGQATPGHVRAAIAVLKELDLYKRADIGCIAMLSDIIADIIARETAAPDMLAALQAMLDDIDGLSLDQLCDLRQSTVATARNAVAKSEGR